MIKTLVSADSAAAITASASRCSFLPFKKNLVRTEVAVLCANHLVLARTWLQFFSATVVFISLGIVPERFLPRMHMRAEVLP